MLNSQEINLLFLKWEFQPLIIMLKVRNTKRILKILKGWTYDQCLRKSLSSQLLPNKRLLSIKKPQPSMVLLVQLSKDPFMCSLKKRIPSMLKYCGVFSWFWFMTATILVVICPNYLKEFSQIVILQRHLLWVKTKCNYTLLYGITPEFKQKLIFDINSSPFYSVTFDKSMNSEFQMYQIDVGIQFWNNSRGLVETCC